MNKFCDIYEHPWAQEEPRALSTRLDVLNRSSTPSIRRTDLLTAESVRMVAMGDRMFFRSHTFTVRSSLPDTTLSPTVKTADVTVLEETGGGQE